MNTKVLLVDDNPDILEMFKIKFEKEGFEVITASDGFNSLNIAVENKPDIILLDIMMPQMDGFDTLKVIRQQTDLNTKIIIFSNLKSNSYIDKAKSLGADDFLVKANTTPKDAVDKVNSMLNQEVSGENSTEENQENKKHCPHCGGEL